MHLNGGNRMRLLLVLAAFAILLPAQALAADPLLMATTTSTDNTGLLDYLAPEFMKDTGVPLRWTATGTGKALKLGAACDVDVLLVHAPAAEKKFIAAGSGSARTEIMYNDFVIIGPAKDPAGVKGMSVTAALKKIRAKNAKFMSRGDDSGTNKKEKALWKGTGQGMPDKESWYVQTGQGMLKTVLIAAERDGYTLVDRGTYIKYEAQNNGNPPLKILVEGDANLFNQYSVVTLNKGNCPDVNHASAMKLADWFAGKRAQKLIADFRLMGKQLFTPNAK
jgi:tungstate transport system substrate-binding protein